MTTPRLALRGFSTLPVITWVTGTFDRPVPFQQQPDDVRLALYGPLAQQAMAANGSLALDDGNGNLVSMLPATLGDPWEALGSDHNSGIAWFGPQAAMAPLLERIQASVLEQLGALTAIPENDGYFELPTWLSWSFEDGTWLLLVYTDVEYQNFGLETIRAPGVMQALWGAHTDDLLLHEFLGAVARPLLAQRGFPVTMEAAEDEDDEVDLDEALEAFTVGDREARTMDAPLLLAFTRHVFCDLMGWDVPPAGVPDTAGQDDVPEEDDPATRALAQTVQRWHAQQVSAQTLPLATGPQTVHLGYTQGTSDKVYLVELAKDGDGFAVRTHNGRRGGKLTPKAHTSGPLPLDQAAALHRTLVRAKVKDGYGVEATTPGMP